MANAHLSKRSWLIVGFSLAAAAMVALTSGPEDNADESQTITNRGEEKPVLGPSHISAEIFEGSIAPSTTSNSIVIEEPDIASIRPLFIWNEYSQRAEEGDLDATYILAFVINECRNVDSEDFLDRIERSNMSQKLKALSAERFERCTPLVSVVGDPVETHNRLYQTLHDEQHPLTMVNVLGNPPVDKRDRLIWALMGNYPEQFMYERAFMAAVVFEREHADHPDVYRQEAWTILYCEASLSCDSRDYLRTLESTMYHDHEINEILEIASTLKEAIRNGDPNALGI